MSRNKRGTEAPMDYEWTNRTPIKPSWSQTLTAEDPFTPRKRPHEDLKSPVNPLDTPRTPIFGSNQNVPFIFNQNTTPQAPNPPPWEPPPFFSPEKAFPHPSSEPNDVDMSELSPNKMEEHSQGKRATCRTVAVGALRRVYNARSKARNHQLMQQRKEGVQEEDASDSDEDQPVVQNMSNHYTLNMPAAPPPQSELPVILLGYLQFLFNLSLILLFLYVVVQFILTVQRDVEHRISEISMDVVQEIAICATQYRSNLCATNPIPAMIEQCGNWETCMNRDPAVVGRARVGAELIAEVVNGFIEPISWKALAFTLTSLSFLTIFINSLLSLFRSRAAAHVIPTHPLHSHPTLPYPHHFGPGGGYLPPAASTTSGWDRTGSRTRYDITEGSEVETPTRRRRLSRGESANVK